MRVNFKGKHIFEYITHYQEYEPPIFENHPFNIFLPPKGQNIIEGILTGKMFF